MADIALALTAAELIEQCANGAPKGFERAGLGFAQQGLELGH